MIYGYARVSTDGQDFNGQIGKLEAAACSKVFREKVSGATAERPQLKRLLKALRPGDIVIVTAVDRLARDTRDLLNILHELKAAGAGFRSIAEPLIDTTSELAEVLIAVLGLAAKLERNRILSRTAEGRARAKAAGKSLGRPFGLTVDQQKECLRRLEAGAGMRELAKSYAVSHSTISRLAARGSA